jgi:DNA-binding MarR family transcriptional regulator
VREKNYNTGLRGVLFEERHYERMGSAIWLYGWLILRQTHQSGAVGWVLGGAAINYREIEEETGFSRKRLERWMKTLRAQGYIETERTPAGVVIRITKAKKFAQPTRKNAEGGPVNGRRTPQIRGCHGQESLWKEQVGDGIGSSLVGRLNDKELLAAICSEVQKQLQKNVNPSGSGEPQNRKANPPQNWTQDRQQQFFYETRRRHELLRAEREEAVRRELAVGTGPEVRRS